jgi:hypothetical protein
LCFVFFGNFFCQFCQVRGLAIHPCKKEE